MDVWVEEVEADVGGGEKEGVGFALWEAWLMRASMVMNIGSLSVPSYANTPPRPAALLLPCYAHLHFRTPTRHPLFSCRHCGRISCQLPYISSPWSGFPFHHGHPGQELYIPQLKVLTPLQRQLRLGLTRRAFQPQHHLLRRLGFLVEDRFRLSSVSGLLAVVPAFPLGDC